MIFDEQIARKPDYYPWATEFIDAMWAGHWTPNEFTFSSDLQNYRVDLTDQEREMIKNTLSAIGQIEIAVKKFWARLGDNLPHPSLVDLGLVMAQIEVIHNRAYEKLLDTLHLHDVFQQNLKLDIIRGRVTYLRKYLDRVYQDNRKQYVYALILFTLFVENVSLFSQFYVVLWFNRFKNVLKDTAQQVDYTKTEECYVDGTEVLTPLGWRLIRDMRVGDAIYQYNPDQTIEATTVTHVTEKDFDGNMVGFEKQGHECIVTPGHDMVYFDHLGRFKKRKAAEMKIHKQAKVPVGGRLTNAINRQLTFEERLRIVIQADGSNSYWINAEGKRKMKGKDGGYSHKIGLTKLRKRQRIEWILANMDVEYKRNFRDEEMIYDIHYNHDFDYKRLKWIDLSKVSRQWCREFIEECVHWDGYRETDDRVDYCSTIKENIDTVQVIAILAGYVTSISRGNESERKETYHDCYKLSIMDRDLVPHSHEIEKTERPYKGKVHCVTVPSGAIITRLNDKTFISGNCLHAKVGMKLVNVMRDEHPELFDAELTDRVAHEAKEAFNAESKIIDWMVGDYEADRISAPILKEYVKGRINDSLVAIGFARPFELNEVLIEQTRWMDEEVYGNAMTDFFHKKSTAYAKANQSFDEKAIFG